MIKKLYSALYRDDGYPFNSIAKECIPIGNPEHVTDTDAALIVWGGSDIDPKQYNHPKSSRTHTGGDRDWREWALMQQAIKIGIPIIGVCRGAQMACAAAGGFLIQHVDNHAGRMHATSTYDGRTIMTNSIHHQMMVAPKEVDHELLAWSTHQLSAKYIYKDDVAFIPPEDWKEPEFYYFPKIKGYAIQWHPEAMNIDSDATKFVLEQINERETVSA